ncbi:MAG: hybrid sensor histidine kinase/response regulator, partial [Synechococcales cyanobacterium]
LAWSSRAILNEQGDVTATVGIGRDISQLKQFQQDLHQLNEGLEQRVQERTQQLEQSNQELARATHLKDEFLTTMSHELRTPLNTILGMAESMREQVFGEINGEQRLALETIERSSYHLLDLMNDILDVSKIASGQMELNLTTTPIHLLCESSLSFIKQQAIKKGISIQTHFPPHIPQLVVDERRMRQVLINLLENAVKFTPPGGVISVHVSLTSSPCPSQYSIHALQTILSPTVVRIAIQDTGIGIAPEDTERIFQPFFQVARSLSRPYDGTGLGLGLVKRLVEMHGGQVGLSSQVGVGSCFTIDLPCQTPQFSGDDPTDPEGVTGSTDGALELPIRSENQRDKQGQPLILLVENNPINTCTVSNYLTANGYEVLTAGNGDEAIILAQSRIPNLILMDIQM